MRIRGFSSRAKRIVSAVPCMLELLRTRATAFGDVGALERVAVRRVAVDGRRPFALEATHRLDVQLDDDRLDPVVAEEAGEGPPDGAIPTMTAR